MLKNSYLKTPDFKYKALSLFVHPCYMEQLLNRKKKKSCPLPVMQLITVASVTITDDKAQDSIQQGYAKT